MALGRFLLILTFSQILTNISLAFRACVKTGSTTYKSRELRLFSNAKDESNNGEKGDMLSDEYQRGKNSIDGYIFEGPSGKFSNVENDGNFKSKKSKVKNPFEAGIATNGGKGALYSDHDLINLLKTHEGISDQIFSPSSETIQSTVSFSVHDLVKNAINENETVFVRETNPKINLDLQSKVKTIRAIASDVDGTILTSSQTMHPTTRKAIEKAVKRASESSTSYRIEDESNPSMSNISEQFFFFPATGKSRKGAYASLGYEISTLLTQSNVPGVFLQGLFCVDTNQNVVFERKLTKDAIHAVEEIVRKEGLSVVGYDGDNLYTTEVTDNVRNLHDQYGEPMPDILENQKPLSQYSPLLHKILLLDNDPEKLSRVIRPQLENLAEKYNATITQAIPTMLEVLPAGCSKAVGVKKVCEALGINMETELLALGDAENDAEMLEGACIGVAMGNGCTIAKSSADYVMEEDNDAGAAGLAMNFFCLNNL